MPELSQINKIQKYCDNRISYEEFLKNINAVDDIYGNEKWEFFKKSPIRMITSENREKLYKYIIEKIEQMKYQG
jgi:hypothetical protein